MYEDNFINENIVNALSILHKYMHSLLWIHTKGDAKFAYKRLRFINREVVRAYHVSKCGLHLKNGKTVADTHTGTTSEGHVCTGPGNLIRKKKKERKKKKLRKTFHFY